MITNQKCLKIEKQLNKVNGSTGMTWRKLIEYTLTDVDQPRALKKEISFSQQSNIFEQPKETGRYVIKFYRLPRIKVPLILSEYITDRINEHDYCLTHICA